MTAPGDRPHPVGVRPAMLADAEAIGALLVRAWRVAYRGGLVPDAHLDALRVEDRVEQWRSMLGGAAPARSAFLVAEIAGAAVGLVAVGVEGLDPEADRGQVYALYIDPPSWRRGIGRALLAAGCAALRDLGFVDAVLWVHRDNAPARAFYEAQGWRTDGAQQREEVHGVEVPEVRYARRLPGA